MTVTSFLIVAAVGYLIGSIPFGLILTRLAGLGDIRKVGSGNIGATNVLRTGNKSLAAATLVCDILKGTAAVLIAPIVASTFAAAADSGWTSAHTAGLAAFAGHLFPIWLSFRGGKGVATYIGVAAGLAVPIASSVLRHMAGDCRTLPVLLAFRLRRIRGGTAFGSIVLDQRRRLSSWR